MWQWLKANFLGRPLPPFTKTRNSHQSSLNEPKRGCSLMFPKVLVKVLQWSTMAPTFQNNLKQKSYHQGGTLWHPKITGPFTSPDFWKYTSITPSLTPCHRISQLPTPCPFRASIFPQLWITETKFTTFGSAPSRYKLCLVGVFFPWFHRVSTRDETFFEFLTRPKFFSTLMKCGWM